MRSPRGADSRASKSVRSLPDCRNASAWSAMLSSTKGDMPAIDWYFDFVSPFSYLQCERLQELPPGTRVRYRPVLFAGLLNHHGQKGPAEIESKRLFTYRFVLWQAQRQGVKLRFPPEHPFNPLTLLRLTIAADASPDVVRGIFHFIWRDGRLADNPIEWAELIDGPGLR